VDGDHFDCLTRVHQPARFVVCEFAAADPARRRFVRVRHHRCSIHQHGAHAAANPKHVRSPMANTSAASRRLLVGRPTRGRGQREGDHAGRHEHRGWQERRHGGSLPRPTIPRPIPMRSLVVLAATCGELSARRAPTRELGKSRTEYGGARDGAHPQWGSPKNGANGGEVRRAGARMAWVEERSESWKAQVSMRWHGRWRSRRSRAAACWARPWRASSVRPGCCRSSGASTPDRAAPTTSAGAGVAVARGRPRSAARPTVAARATAAAATRSAASRRWRAVASQELPPTVSHVPVNTAGIRAKPARPSLVAGNRQRSDTTGSQANHGAAAEALHAAGPVRMAGPSDAPAARRRSAPALSERRQWATVIRRPTRPLHEDWHRTRRLG
jgi:hypothetical protein